MLEQFLFQCPSTLGEERLYNPFLRTEDRSLLRTLELLKEEEEEEEASENTPIPFGLRVTALKMIRKRKDDVAAAKP